MNKIPDMFFEFYPALTIPEKFWGAETGNTRCLYMATCKEDEFLYATDAFETILGYSREELYTGGLKWWFALVHPEDLGPMLNSIFQHCFMTPVSERLNKPFELSYRLRHTTGRWIWLREIKCIVAVTKEGRNHFILGRFEQISSGFAHDEMDINRIVQEHGSQNSMLKAAIPILTGKTEPDYTAPTKREKEILQLIGEGFSTKQMADRLHISINTVETHRRHLLEKLKVKNSMEMIKLTAHAVWMKPLGYSSRG